MVNDGFQATGDWFLFCWGHLLLQVMVAEFEKKTVSCNSLREVKCIQGHFKTCSWLYIHNKIDKLSRNSGLVVMIVGFQSGEPCSICQRGIFTTLLLS